jgi:L-gulonate 5-dehydrogenase
MKAIQIEKPEMLRVIDMEKPIITTEDNVLIKMKAVGICGSDVGIYHGTNAAATYPRVIGHEMVGKVEEVGKGVTRVKPGDRVIVDQVKSCGHCYACRIGRGNVCGNLEVRGVHIDGGYREYMAIPETACYVLPESLSDEDAVMIEPTTIAIQCCSRAQLSKEDTLLIYGCGSLGSSILKIASLRGCKIIVADIVDQKLEDLESRIKDLTDGYGVTISIDAACIKNSLLTLLKVTGNAGRVMTMGFSTAPTEINQFLITSKELDVRGSRLQNKKFGDAIELIKQGKLDLNGSVSHTYPFVEAQKAFDFIDTKDPSIRKIVLTFG